MVRFSCFLPHVHSNSPKKTVQRSIEVMANTLQDDSQNRGSTSSSIPTTTTSSNPSCLKAHEEKKMNNAKSHGSNWASADCGCQSEDLKSMFVTECNRQVHHTGCLKKSQSLESGLYQVGGLYTDNLTEGDTDPGFSYNGSKSDNESTISAPRKDQEANPTNPCKRHPNSEDHISFHLGGDDSISSIGDPTPSDKDAHGISNTPPSVELAGDSDDHNPFPLPGTPLLLVKSCSLPSISASTLSSGNCSFKHASSKSRSSDDLCALGLRQKEKCINDSDDQIKGEHAVGNNMGNIDSSFTDVYESYSLSGVAKDWIMPVGDNINSVKTHLGESHLGELHNKDFRIKRIEDWVIGLQHCGPLEGTNESHESIEPLNGDVNTMNGLTAARVHGKVTPGMEAAKRYISSLSANATAAQLKNHGLVVIPFLSAFASLKVLNLSGNAIVRITMGALPRGLHILNLSKNNISTIEGLRELTRLRVLDLSYNRIIRIGHGIASCSSLKELYLAGNKISEIECLHRLLKLSVLDLRFNKISTAKCLGQLAANYNSLKAVSLEGNPAQKNVGDEQLKKHLQGLLPHLAYYNRQTIKASTLKDAADRSVRLGTNSHQFDHSLRSDHKITRKGNHGVSALRPSTSSTQTHRSQIVDSPRGLKGRQGHLPPIGNKVSTQSRHHFDVGSKPLNFKPGLSIRRSRSEGTLGSN